MKDTDSSYNIASDVARNIGGAFFNAGPHSGFSALGIDRIKHSLQELSMSIKREIVAELEERKNNPTLVPEPLAHTSEPRLISEGDPCVIESPNAVNPVGFVAMTLPDPELGWNGTCETTANARRIARRVNACKGINPEAVPYLLEACDMVQRAWAGDSIEMAEAVDACLLAIQKAEVKTQE